MPQEAITKHNKCNTILHRCVCVRVCVCVVVCARALDKLSLVQSLSEQQEPSAAGGSSAATVHSEAGAPLRPRYSGSSLCSYQEAGGQ